MEICSMCRGQSHWREHHPGDTLGGGEVQGGKVGDHTKQRLERRATGIFNEYIYIYIIILYYIILYYIILYV